MNPPARTQNRGLASLAWLLWRAYKSLTGGTPPARRPRSRPGRSLPQSKLNRSIYAILGGLLDIANRNLWNRLGKAAFTRHSFTNSAHSTRRRNSFRAPTSLFQRSILFG